MTKKKTKKPRRIQFTDQSDKKDHHFLCSTFQGEKAVLCLYTFWIHKADVKRLARWFADAEKWVSEK